MTNADMDILHAANTAAAASDRWVMFAAILTTLSGAAVALRWVTGKFIATMTEMSARLAANTEALNDVRHVLETCRAAQMARLNFPHDSTPVPQRPALP